MSIDRIGKAGGGLPVEGAGPAAPSEIGAKPTAEFKVSRPGAVDAAEPSSLDRLRAGEISLNEYLDAQVHQATAHLDGRLSADQLSFIRENLREQLSTDPVLVDLVKSTTGAMPSARE
jgi:hypothetical protein